MIRYPINLDELKNRIDKEKPSWRRRATTATNYYTSKGAYSEPPKDTTAPSPFWAEIKWVYLDLQRRKCAYCERRPSSWAGDYAIEHFRPKSRVDDWPTVDHPKQASFAFASNGGASQGYYLIAYHILNYTAACSQCNTRLKRNFFPIHSSRDIKTADPIALLSSEQPYLIYPLGNHDTDPENLIGFDGIIPCPKTSSSSHDHRRAEVTIDLLGLQVREELLRERASILDSLIDDLVDEHNHPDPQRRRKARNAILRSQSRGSEHSSCAKCFVALYRRDPVSAKQIAKDATRYLNSTVRLGLPRP